MKKFALLLSVAMVAGCATTENTGGETDEIVVTASKSAQGSSTAPAPNLQRRKYTQWDGTVSYGPAPAAPAPQRLIGGQLAAPKTLNYSSSVGSGASGGYQVEVIPPEYEAVERRIQKSPASAIERTVPAIVRDGVVLQEATTQLLTAPPVYETVTEQVPTTSERYILRGPRGKILREFASADEFAKFESNPFKRAEDEPVSTFAADVDTASYSFARTYVRDGKRPPKNSIRVEEMINYFDYDYDVPASKSEPFKTSISVVPSPWNRQTKLIQIGVQGYNIPDRKRPDMNLVFLIDVSGSMKDDNKLPLLIRSFETFVKNLTPEDTVGIVTYGPTVQTVLEPTSDVNAILAAIRPLTAQGGTAGEAGLQKAYEVAESAFDRKGTNRVILATDGDFNIGISDPEELKSFIENKRDSQIYLSVLGFGKGNVKDNRMQAMAQNGNGTAGYIDSLREARKFFDNDMGKNFFPIADDLKIQVEFNPARVAEYRLIGYETRALNREDFNNDKIDAGDIGAGHSVTAIYEINPVGAKAQFVDPLRYGVGGKGKSETSLPDEYGFVKLRYKKPGESTSKLISTTISTENELRRLKSAPRFTRFATAAAAYGLLLREDAYMNDMSWADVTSLALGAKGADIYGYRSEFIELTKDAAAISD